MRDLVTQEQVEAYSLYDIKPIITYLNMEEIQSLFVKNMIDIIGTDNLENIKRDSAIFYDKYFRVHDIYHVLQLSSNIFTRRRTQKIIDNIYDNNIKISPFDLPVYFNENNGVNAGLLLYKRTTSDNKPIDLFRSIFLPNGDAGYITECYIHEIAHSQVPPKGWGLSCDINDEVIPIFLELLYNKNNRKALYFRLKNLLDTYNSLKKYEYDLPAENRKSSLKYIISILEALMLFYLYDTEVNTSLKVRIIDDIQDVFDGKIETIDMLEKNGVVEESYKTLEFVRYYTK